jgi:glycosyltransferase 2 family protein
MTRALSWFLVKWVLTITLLAGSAWLLDFRRIGEAIVSIGVSAFAATVVLSFLGSIVLPAFSTATALSAANIRISIQALVVINLCVRFYTLILPRAVSVAVRWQRYRAHSDGPRAAALMLFERLVQLLVYLLAAGVFLLIQTPPHVPFQPALLPISLVGLVTLGILAVVLMRLCHPATRPAARVPTWLNHQALRLWRAIQAYRGLSPYQLSLILSLYIANYFSLVTAGWIIAEAMGLPLTWNELAWIRPVVFLLTLFPLTINGMGIRELGFVGFLSIYGIERDTAFAFGLCLSAVHVVLGSIGAIFEVRHAARGFRRNRIGD